MIGEHLFIGGKRAESSILPISDFVASREALKIYNRIVGDTEALIRTAKHLQFGNGAD